MGHSKGWKTDGKNVGRNSMDRRELQKGRMERSGHDAREASKGRDQVSGGLGRGTMRGRERWGGEEGVVTGERDKKEVMRNGGMGQRESLSPVSLWLASPSDWQEEQGGQQGDGEGGLTTGLHVPRR